jgi:hypothetical protein
MNDISQSILISEIRHCIVILKTGDIKGGTQRLGQLADNMQAAMAKNTEMHSPAEWVKSKSARPKTNSIYQGSSVPGSLDDKLGDS